MKNKKCSVYSFLILVFCIAQNVFISVSWAGEDDKANWQKGVIEGAIMFNPHVPSQHIRVEIHANCAVLKGYVGTEVARALAEQMALSVSGIEQVINKLVVAPEKWDQMSLGERLESHTSNRLTNVTITNKVRSQLLANRITTGMEIDVETQNQVVTVSGSVNSEAEKALAYWIIKNTQGVKTVVDKLDIVSNTTGQAVVQIAE